jgi:hypothetical protein
MSLGVYQVVYSSFESKNLSTTDLDEIITISQKNNSKKDITGILLYSEGTFLQLLEGNKSDILNLYNTIVKDPRHSQISKILEIQNGTRIFKDWSMGFKNLNKTEFSKFNEFLIKPENIKQKTSLNQNLILEILTTFIE